MSFDVKAYHAEYMRAWRQAHPERAVAISRQTIEPARAWREANPERSREIRRQAMARWRANHPDEARKNSRDWHAANPENRREWGHRDRVRRAGAPTCDHPACLALGPVHLAWQVNPHRCYLCGVPVYMGKGGNLHFDHVQPIARGGLHCADNLRPACGPCNLSKGAKAA